MHGAIGWNKMETNGADELAGTRETENEVGWWEAHGLRFSSGRFLHSAETLGRPSEQLIATAIDK